MPGSGGFPAEVLLETDAYCSARREIGIQSIDGDDHGSWSDSQISNLIGGKASRLQLVIFVPYSPGQHVFNNSATCIKLADASGLQLCNSIAHRPGSFPQVTTFADLEAQTKRQTGRLGSQLFEMGQRRVWIKESVFPGNKRLEDGRL